jgi:hypothetical protein
MKNMQFRCKKEYGSRSQVVRTFFKTWQSQKEVQMREVFRCMTSRLGRVALVSGLWLLAACSHGSTRVPPTTTDGETGRASIRSSLDRSSCKSDSQCRSGQRCGFTRRTGCEGSGTCIIEKAGASCADPGGRCGCDGQPVDVFCAVGSSSEFTSAPAPFVGPCPIPCTASRECPSRLVCDKGICAKPHDGRRG